MLIEWIKSIMLYFEKSNAIMKKDVNGNEFSKVNICLYRFLFLCITTLLVIGLPQGISESFIDYIKDILAIFVGFFVTVLTFVFDKLDIEKIPCEEEMNSLPVDQRWSSEKIIKAKREHNYTIRFFYSVGLIIIFSTFALALLIPNIFWGTFFNEDIRRYEFIASLDMLNSSTIGTALHLLFCVVYRFIVLFLIVKVFYFTLFTVSSLLQVLISKKKFDSWK